jgi:hypothetical protein
LSWLKIPQCSGERLGNFQEPTVASRVIVTILLAVALICPGSAPARQI